MFTPFPVLPEQRRGQAVLRAVVQGAAGDAGLRAGGAVGAELPAAAARAVHAPGRPARLHAAAHRRPAARGGHTSHSIHY